jgi:Ca2+-binding EF-hand superfamily protein
MTSIPQKARVLLLIAASAVGSGTAFAQSNSNSKDGATMQAAAPKTGKTVRSMFEWADKNKDGQLTRAEAKGHLPITYQNFASLDTDKRGWISFEQFVEFTNKRVGKNADDILKIGQRL